MVKSSSLRTILLSPRGGISAIVLLVVMICAVFAPLIAPYAYDIQSLRDANLNPSWKNWMGTDEFGRDLLSRMIYGARTSLSVALTAISISVAIGMSLGATSAYFGGAFDRLVTAAVDLTWSFPES